jgi:spermidine/putrescine-binding protein
MMRARGRPIPRRQFVRSGAVVAGAAMAAPLLVACESREETQELSWLNWQDYIDEETIPEFENQTGIQVTYITYESNDELEDKLIQAARPRRGGRGPVSYDLIVPSDNFVVRFARLELIGELDHDLIESLDNLRPDLREAGFDPGNRYSVPWATGTTGIGYDSAVFSEPPGYDVFLNEEHSGRMTILNETRDAFGLALFSLGLDPNTTSEDDISAAADRLIEMKRVIRDFDSDNYLEDLAGGDLVAAHAYSSDVLQARQQNPNLEFVLPQEGALKWVDSLAVPTDAGRSENAHRFIGFYLRPEVSARVAEAIQADTGNAAALELVSETLRSNPVVFPDQETLQRLVFTEDLGEEVEELYEDAWERVLAS